MLDPMPRQDVKLPPTPREAELMAEIERLRATIQAAHHELVNRGGTYAVPILAAEISESGEQSDE